MQIAPQTALVPTELANRRVVRPTPSAKTARFAWIVDACLAKSTNNADKARCARVEFAKKAIVTAITQLAPMARSVKIMCVQRAKKTKNAPKGASA